MNITALIVGILLLLAAGAVLVFLPITINAQQDGKAHNRAFNQTRTQWPTALGTVIKSRQTPWNRVTYSGVSVDFRYQVQDVNHVGKQEWQSNDSQFSMRKRRISEGGPEVYWAKEYPLGKAVPIHYNPTNPAEAFFISIGSPVQPVGHGSSLWSWFS